MSPLHGWSGQVTSETDVTSPRLVLFPDSGMTKAEVVTYYRSVAPRLLPLLRDRPVARIRCPQGTAGESLFEQRIPLLAPEWIDRVTVQHQGRRFTYPRVPDERHLVWLAQQAVLELHVPQWRTGAVAEVDRDRAGVDRMVIDLDPGPGRSLEDCIELGQQIDVWLGSLGVATVPVTSGGLGLHLYTRWPIDGFDARSKDFAQGLAELAVRLRPDLVVSNTSLSARVGRVLLQGSQNDSGALTISPYSLRARSKPWVAAPRSWDDLRETPRQLTAGEVVERLAEPDPMDAITVGSPERDVAAGAPAVSATGRGH